MKQFGTGRRIAAASFAAAVAVCFGAATLSVADENTPPQPVETVDGGPVVTNPVPIPGTDPPAVVAPGPEPVPAPAPEDSAASDPALLTPAAPRTDYSQPAPPAYNQPAPPAPYVVPVEPATPGNIPVTETPAAEPAANEESADLAEPTIDPSPAATPAAAVPTPSGTGPPTTGASTQAAAVAPTGSPLIVQLLTVGLLLVVGFFYFRFIGSRDPRTPAKSAK